MEHRARKRFGQNFLHDEGVIARIVAAINPKAGERMVEIGPGLGALTTHLLPRLGALDVVELDRDVIPHLTETCAGLGELRVHQADALKFDFTALAGGSHQLRVAGNLPYNISTPILFHLIDQIDALRDMHFMLQKEVVDRLAAAPGTADYGRLSVMVQYHCRVQKLFEVPPHAFRPAPKVDSAIVRLVPHEKPPVEVHDLKAFSELVARCFSQRRKTLRNNLKGWLDAEGIEALGIDPAIRAETLGLAEFARLSNAVTHAKP